MIFNLFLLWFLLAFMKLVLLYPLCMESPNETPDKPKDSVVVWFLLLYISKREC